LLEFYTSAVYPAVLVVAAILVLAGLVTLAVVVAAQVVVVGGAMLGGADIGIVITIGYLLASIALLPLLGIGRLGHPDAAAEDPDPNRPVLAPDQIARVDAGAAIIVAVALAVVAWRIASIIGAS
jgi:hypothetical protein